MPDSIALKNERCLACVGSSPYSMSEIWPPSTPGIRMTVWICGSFASSADTRNAPPALMPITSGSFTSIADAGGIVNVPRIVARTRYETDVEPRGRLSAYLQKIEMPPFFGQSGIARFGAGTIRRGFGMVRWWHG